VLDGADLTAATRPRPAPGPPAGLARLVNASARVRRSRPLPVGSGRLGPVGRTRSDGGGRR
jgi:hypothetical protein